MAGERKQGVLITGGSGMIGRYLTSELVPEGYRVSILSRDKDQSRMAGVYRWDPEKGSIDPDAFYGVDHIIHLAGANIGAKRWSSKRKNEILRSRVDSARLIHKVVKENEIKLSTFISASATGYYGSENREKIFRESDPASNDFLGNVCRQWEETAGLFEKDGIRTVIIRTAVTLEKSDSAIERIMLPARFGFLATVGDGRQYLPWIHLKDLAGIYLQAVKDESISGVFNGVSPRHVTHNEFMKTLSEVIEKPLLPIHVPAIVLKLLYGEMADIVLKGSRVSSEKIRNAGYRFEFDNLEKALRDIFGR